MRESGESKATVVFICLLVLLLGAGCVRNGPGSLEGAGPLASRVVSMSSEVFVLPPTPSIPAPQSFREPREMWEPDEHVVRRDVDEATGAFALHEIMAQWLPHGEADTMRRFMRLVSSADGLSPSMLNRMRRDIPMIRKVFMDCALPPELVFLPVIESSFEPWAVSPAGAAGLWQLMPETARRYGLTVSGVEDERFDTRRSTNAAAAYLAELYRLFRDWPLALAAYNCGEGAMARALERTGARTLSELTAFCRADRDFRRLLSSETLDYVPRFVGAVRAMSALPEFEALMSSADGDARRAAPDASLPAVAAQGGSYHGGEAMRLAGAVLEATSR